MSVPTKSSLDFVDSLTKPKMRWKRGRPRKNSLQQQSSKPKSSRIAVKEEPQSEDDEAVMDFEPPPSNAFLECPSPDGHADSDADWNPQLEEANFQDEEYVSPASAKRGRGRPRSRPDPVPKMREEQKRKVLLPKRPVGRPPNPDQKSKQNFRLMKRKIRPEPHGRQKYHHQVHRCDICGKVYFKRISFLKHKQAHEEAGDKGASSTNPPSNTATTSTTESQVEETKQCPVCQESLHLSDYFEHLLSHETNPDPSIKTDLFVCPHKDCIRQFRLEENFTVHMEVDHSELNSRSLILVKKCDVCDLCYDTSSDLLEHMRKAHPDLIEVHPLVLCPVCSYSFTSTSNLIIHMHSHVTPEQQICFVCRKSLPNRSELLQHLSSSHSLRTSKTCSTCQEHFEDIYSHKVHLRTEHKRKENFICSFCGKICYFPKSFVAHFRMHARLEKRGLPCSDCSEKFRNEDELARHQVLVHNAPKIPCEVCGKQYMTPTLLKIHQKEHNKQGFHCATCDKYFNSKARHTNHMAKHSDERPFTCELCGKSYKTDHQLCRHRETHELKFECELCGRRFARFTQKKNHMGLHTGEKIICQFCGVVCHSQKSANKHVKTYHTGENPLPVKRQMERGLRMKWRDADGNVVYGKTSGEGGGGAQAQSQNFNPGESDSSSSTPAPVPAAVASTSTSAGVGIPYPTPPQQLQHAQVEQQIFETRAFMGFGYPRFM